MGIGVLIVFFLLLAFLLFFLWLFVHFIKKKSKTGIVISSILLLSILSVFFTNNLDELTISKEDVKKDLKQIEIELNGNFIIKKNNVSGMPERFQTTEIEISKSEIEKIINKIRNSKNFKVYKTESEVYNNDISLNNSLNGLILNFKYPEYYSREVYKEIDNIPTRIFLTVYEEKNILKYQKMED